MRLFGSKKKDAPKPEPPVSSPKIADYIDDAEPKPADAADQPMELVDASNIEIGAEAGVAAPVETDAPDAEAAAAEAAEALRDDGAEERLVIRPEPLTAAKHGAFRVDPTKGRFAFARRMHLAPLSLREFGQAALSYPIVFIGAQLRPYAVMGVQKGVNLYIDEAGRIDPAWYAPAFFRRAPFVYAKMEGASQNVLCLDVESECLVETGGAPLFENGEPSALTKMALASMKAAYNELQETERFVEELKALDLITPKSVKLAARGRAEPSKNAIEFNAVAVERLAALTPEEQRKLQASNALYAIYAHHMSLYNWRRVLERAAAALARR